MANSNQSLHHVSSSLSKIPYVGFSSASWRTSNWNSTMTFTSIHKLKHRTCIPSRNTDLYIAKVIIDENKRYLASLCKPPSSSSDNHPVQSPLALLWVMLSQWVFAYYELIRNSCPLSPISPPAGGLYVESLPYGTVWAGKQEAPQFNLPIYLCMPSFRQLADGLSGSRLFNLRSRWSSPTSERLDIHETLYTSVLIQSLFTELQSSLYVIPTSLSGQSCSPYTDKGFYSPAFAPQSHLSGTWSMTTRVYSQFPRLDFSRRDSYGAPAK